MEAVSLVCQLFGALVLAVNAAPYFWWGDSGQHVEVWSSSWADASCYMRRHVSFNVVSTSLRCVERAQTRQQYSATEIQCCRRCPRGVGARAPVRTMQLPEEVVSGGEFCARLEAVVSVGE